MKETSLLVLIVLVSLYILANLFIEFINLLLAFNPLAWAIFIVIIGWFIVSEIGEEGEK